MDDLIQKLEFSPDTQRYYLTYLLVFVALFFQRRFFLQHAQVKQFGRMAKVLGIIMVVMVIIPVLLAAYVFLIR